VVVEVISDSSALQIVLATEAVVHASAYFIQKCSAFPSLWRLYDLKPLQTKFYQLAVKRLISEMNDVIAEANRL